MNSNDYPNGTIRILDCGHEHALHFDVDSKGFKCPTRVKAILPCGHETIKKPCHIDVNEWRCDFSCDARIEPCGHSCVRTCHVNYDPDHTEYKCSKTCDRILQGCSTKTHLCQMYCYQPCSSCKAVVTKKLPNCNHLQVLECSESGDNIVCEESCTKKIAKCGHDCKLKCHEPCGGCAEMVMKALPTCGHEVLTKCSELPSKKNCQASCSKTLPCGHPCKEKCNEICTEFCRELVDHTNPTFCEHIFKIECHMNRHEVLMSYSNNLLRFCKNPCTAVLACLHKCSGTCGECAQGRIHVTCMEKCGTTLFCGHECKVPCREVCQPCQLTCGMKCSHNKCTKTCGEECTKCQESCTRRCKHVECTSKCGDICNVPPCQEPCEKKLPCSHPCVGFCGDPCPTLCRICNATELEEVFLGHEDKENARFVLLDECKHVIESQGMERFFKRNGSNGIDYIRCPKCRTPLTSTQRYSDYIKQVIKDIAIIKRKSSGSFDEIKAKRGELLVQLKRLDDIQQFDNNAVFEKFLQECGVLLRPINKNRRQVFDLMIGKTLEAKLTIVQNIGNVLQSQDNQIICAASDNEIVIEATDYVEYLLARLTKQVERITNQEIQDFKREQDRVLRIAQFVNIDRDDLDWQELDEIRELIYRPVIYTNDYDKIVKVKLEECLKKMGVDEGLTNEERFEIVSATGLKKGHWFKCPNGHIYVIGECGGAMEVGNCYECGVEIGGLNHALLPNNSHAGEMDDSQYPAWSNTANNLLNYGLNDFQ